MLLVKFKSKTWFIVSSLGKTKENVTRNRLFPSSSEEDNNSSNVPGKCIKKWSITVAVYSDLLVYTFDSTF